MRLTAKRGWKLETKISIDKDETFSPGNAPQEARFFRLWAGPRHCIPRNKPQFISDIEGTANEIGI